MEISRDILRLYEGGAPISVISDEFCKTEEEVCNILREYKKHQRVKGKYTNELMKVIARRDSNGVLRKKIMSELQISRSFLVKSIEEYGFLKKLELDDDEEFYKEVSHDYTFTECPECNSKKINEINTLYNDFPVKGVYCLKCGNEFVKRENHLFKVKWENIK